MKTYETTIYARQVVTLKAKNAEAFNARVERMVEDIEFATDLDCEFGLEEDEMICCPHCDGDRIDPASLLCADEAPDCPRCEGQGELEFEEHFDDEDDYR